MTEKKINYLNNKDMLLEIHKSKNSYCEYDDAKYSEYDAIVENVDNIFDESTIQTARYTRAKKMTLQAYEQEQKKPENKNKKLSLAKFKVEPDSIDLEDLIFRVMTYDHIPLDKGRRKNPKTESERRVKLNFVPFIHVVIKNLKKKKYTVVGKSHHKNGQFCLDHGAMTDKLAHMFMLLVHRYSQKSNWRGYTYVDEMRGQALLQLSQMGLQFNEAKSDNPFAYYTASITNSFTRVLNKEKENQDLRDDIMEEQGQTPSFTRQLQYEETIRRLREDAQDINLD